MVNAAQSDGWSAWRPSLTLRLGLLGGAFVVVIVGCLSWVFLQSQQALDDTVRQDAVVSAQLTGLTEQSRELASGIARVRAQVLSASSRGAVHVCTAG